MRSSFWVVAALTAGCGAVESNGGGDDAGTPDGRPPDAGPSDAGPPDAGAGVCPAGHASDGTRCVDVVGALDERRVEVACLRDNSTDTCIVGALPPAWMATVGGAPGAAYQVTLRIRGVVEQKTYDGGSRIGYWSVGGTPESKSGYNVYRLRVGEVDYFLNAGTSAIPNCWALDYTQPILVRTGDALLFETSHTDTAIIKNRDGNGTPIIVPGIAPSPESFNGQFVQIDVERVEPMP